MKLVINGKTVEVDNETLSKAIEEEKDSVEVNSEDLSIRTKDEEDKFVENLKSETGSTTSEISRKELLKSIGLEPNGAHKSEEKTVEAINNYVNEQVKSKSEEPNKHLEQMESDLQQLKDRNKELEEKSEMTAKEFKEYKNNLKRRSEIERNLPDNLAYDKEDMLLILDNKIKTKVDDDGRVVVLDRDGNVKKDGNLDPISLDKEFENFFSENKNYIKTPEGGKGGSDSSTETNSKSIEAFDKRMETKGVKRNSMEYNKELAAAQKAGELEI